MATEELKYMNIAKGWLIIFVVMGHIGNDFLTDFLHCTMTFQMVVFYFICGYFTKINTSSFKELISTWWHRFSKIYFTYLKYELLFLVCKNLFFKVGFYSTEVSYAGKFIHPDTWIDFFKNVVLIVVGMGREPMAGAFWFFVTLLFLITILTVVRYVVVNCFPKYVESLTFVVVFLIFLAGSVLNYYDILIPRLVPAFTMIMPFYLGYIQREKHLKPTYNNSLLAVIAVILLFAITYVGYCAVNTNTFGFSFPRLGIYQPYIWMQVLSGPVYMLLLTFVGAYAVIGSSRVIENHTKYLSQFLRYVGKKSMAIMIFHFLAFRFVSLIQYAFGKIEFKDMANLLGNGISPFWFLMNLIAGVVLSIAFYWMVEKAIEKIKCVSSCSR